MEDLKEGSSHVLAVSNSDTRPQYLMPEAPKASSIRLYLSRLHNAQSLYKEPLTFHKNIIHLVPKIILGNAFSWENANT